VSNREAFLFRTMDIITKAEAKAAGLKRYFTGLACKHGHVAERLVSNRGCYQCILEHSQQPDVKTKAAERYQQPTAKAKAAERMVKYRQANAENIAAKKADYRQANAEKLAAKNKAYRQANRAELAAKDAAYAKDNREKIAVTMAKYYAANAERFSARAAEYRKANPHILNALNAKRRAAKLQATPSWADFEDIKVIYKQCAERTRLTGIPHAVDHVYPLISDDVCGLHVAANLQIITASENSRKNNRMPTPEQVPSDLE
jgi:hypothetical protein